MAQAFYYSSSLELVCYLLLLHFWLLPANVNLLCKALTAYSSNFNNVSRKYCISVLLFCQSNLKRCICLIVVGKTLSMVKKIGLFISAFIPLYILLVLKILIQIANGNLHFNVLNSTMLALLTLLTLVGAICIALCLKTKSCTKISVISAKNMTENYFLGYFSLFVLFALTFSIEFIAMAVSFVIILVFVGFVYIKNEMFYINPTLNILGFSLYQITYLVQNTTATIFVFSQKTIEPKSCIKIYGSKVFCTK